MASPYRDCVCPRSYSFLGVIPRTRQRSSGSPSSLGDLLLSPGLRPRDSLSFPWWRCNTYQYVAVCTWGARNKLLESNTLPNPTVRLTSLATFAPRDLWKHGENRVQPRGLGRQLDGRASGFDWGKSPFALAINRGHLTQKKGSPVAIFGRAALPYCRALGTQGSSSRARRHT